MAAADADPFADLPSDITLGQAKQAWARVDMIKEQLALGKDAKYIVSKIHAPRRVVEWAIGKIAEADAQPQLGPTDTPHPRARAHARQSPPVREAQDAPRDGGGGGQTAADPPPAPPESGEAPPQATDDRDELLRRIGQPVPRATAPGHETPDPLLTPIYAEPTTDALRGTSGTPRPMMVEIPSSYARVTNSWTLYGMKAEKAAGVMVLFQDHDKPDDVGYLRQLIVATGYAPNFADRCVEAYQKIMFPKARPGEPPTEGGEGAAQPASLEEIRRRAGLPPLAVGPDTDRASLAAEAERLAVEKTRLDMREQRIRMGLEPAPGAPEEEDPIVDVVLNMGGMPVPKKVRQSQVGLYSAWIPRAPSPGGAQTPDEPPPWAKAILDEQARFRQRDEEERQRRSQADAIAQAVAPLQKQLSELTQRPPSDGGQTSAEVRALRLQLEDKKWTDLNSTLVQMKGEIARGGSPEAMAETRRRLEIQARALGLDVGGNSSRLDQEQILLEAERKAATRKDEAAGQAIGIAADRARQKPLQELLTTTGLDRVIKERVQEIATTPGERGQSGDPPTQEQLDEIERQLHAQGATPPPPAAPPPRAGGIDVR